MAFPGDEMVRLASMKTCDASVEDRLKVEFDWAIAMNEWAGCTELPYIRGPNVIFGNIFVSGRLTFESLSKSNKGKFRITQTPPTNALRISTYFPGKLFYPKFRTNSYHLNTEHLNTGFI